MFFSANLVTVPPMKERKGNCKIKTNATFVSKVSLWSHFKMILEVGVELWFKKIPVKPLSEDWIKVDPTVCITTHPCHK